MNTVPRLSDWQPDTFEIKIGDMLLSVVDSNEYVEDSRKEMHFHSVFEFQYVTSKPMKIRTEGKTYNVCDGEYIIIPPNRFHSSEISGTEKSCFLFSVNFLPKVKSEISEYRHYNRIFSSLKGVRYIEMPQCPIVSTVSFCRKRTDQSALLI